MQVKVSFGVGVWVLSSKFAFFLKRLGVRGTPLNTYKFEIFDYAEAAAPAPNSGKETAHFLPNFVIELTPSP